MAGDVEDQGKVAPDAVHHPVSSVTTLKRACGCGRSVENRREQWDDRVVAMKVRGK